MQESQLLPKIVKAAKLILRFELAHPPCAPSIVVSVSIEITNPSLSRPGISVLIPACNEEAAVGRGVEEITAVLSGIQGLPREAWEILVIDDGSRDNTAENARAAGAALLTHATNLGYGAALKSGLRRARFETIIITDADGTYPASAIPQLLAMMTDYDMAVGSRTGDDVHIPAIRRPAKFLLKLTAEYLADQKIPDLNSGLRVFRRSDAIRFFNLYPRGFSFTTTITLAFLSSDMLIGYLPINYHPRTGKSKIRPIRDTKNLFLTVVRSILFFNPLRVCMPIGIGLLVLAFIIAIGPRDIHGNIYDGTITILTMAALQIIIMGFLADILARLRR